MRVNWDMTSMRTGTRWRSSAPAPALVRPRYILAHYPPDLRLVDTRKGGGEGLESAELRESLCTPRSCAMRADVRKSRGLATGWRRTSRASAVGVRDIDVPCPHWNLL